MIARSEKFGKCCPKCGKQQIDIIVPSSKLSPDQQLSAHMKMNHPLGTFFYIMFTFFCLSVQQNIKKHDNKKNF